MPESSSIFKLKSLPAAHSVQTQNPLPRCTAQKGSVSCSEWMLQAGSAMRGIRPQVLYAAGAILQICGITPAMQAQDASADGQIPWVPPAGNAAYATAFQPA